MRGCGSSHASGVRLSMALACLAIASCTRHQEVPIDGVVVLDEDIQLVRAERRDTARRELTADSGATFIAFVYEEDCDVTLRLEYASGTTASSRFSEVNNTMFGESLEVAALAVPSGSSVALRLESAQDSDVACHSRVRILRYDQSVMSNPRLAARVAAFRSWSAATRASRTFEDTKSAGLRDMDAALAHLESDEGDRWLAAWARLVRADLNYLPGIDYRLATGDARRAWRAFTELEDARNAARARYVLATSLIEISVDKGAIDPTAEEADREARTLLKELTADPALSALQRVRAVNFLGYHAMGQGEWVEAGNYFRQALAGFRELGNRQGQQMTLNNLGVLAGDLGDFQVATQYFDQVVAMLDQVGIGIAKDRVLLLHSAARADTDAGYVDRAIARLLLAQEWGRDLHDPQQDARILHALGRAYWARGDLAQASAFFAEGLRVRRTLNDPIGVMASLRYAGTMARESGRLDEALRLHREAADLAGAADLRLRGLLDLAMDYGAAADFPRAIATCREALAQPSVSPEFHKRLQAQIALGDFLLSQSKPGAGAIAEAEALAAGPLNAAIRRYDIAMELAARHLRARALAARAQWTPARAEYERAIGLIFRYSSASTNPELQASSLAREHETFRGYLDLLMRDAVARGSGVLSPATEDELAALRMLEWARATSFANSRTMSLDAKTAAQMDALLAQMAGKRVRIAALLDRAGDSSQDVEKLQLDIARMRAEIDRLRAQAHQPTLMSNASFMGTPELPALPEGVAQWSYALGSSAVYLWLRDDRGVRTGVLPLSAGELERRLASVSANAKRSSAVGMEHSLQQLQALLAPSDAMRAAAAEIDIVADGILTSAPFAALLHAGDRAITMKSSLFQPALAPDRRSRTLRFVGVAGSSGVAGAARGNVFTTLGATTSEARSIATFFERPGGEPRVKLLLGVDGSSTELAGLWRGGIDVLHFATHGLADLRRPLTSLLMLPAKDAAGNPTYLTAGQVQEWRGDAELVYLSACETAVGPARFADGMPGLQRAFLRAGARGVIATLWPVEDVYASQFASDFYRRYTAGKPAPRALAETQRAWLEPVAGVRASEQARRRMTAWAHAYYTQ
jgi:CHAT domain-containing protein